MLATGVDIVEIRRIGELLERHGDRFRQRVFTDREWSEAGGRIESLAARFAAKEALIKALGIRELTLREIEVVRPERSQPSLRLRGRAAATARALGVRELALSLAHEHQHAIAIVVARRDGDAPAWDGSDDDF